MASRFSPLPDHGRKTPASSSLQHADACVTLVDIAGESVTYLSVRVSSVHMLAAPYYLIAGAHGARGDWPRAAFEPAQRAQAVPPPHRTRTVGQGRSSAPLPSPHARIPLAAVGCGKGQPVGWGWSTGRASPHWVVAAPPDSSTACPPAVARGPESTTVTHTHSPRTSPWTVRARAGASAAACIARTDLTWTATPPHCRVCLASPHARSARRSSALGARASESLRDSLS